MFISVDDALRFAYSVQGNPNITSAYQSKKDVAQGGLGHGLTGIEKPGQAGMIQRKVSSLGKLHESIVITRYMPSRIECTCGSDCCSTLVKNPAWEHAAGYLADMAGYHALDKHRLSFKVRRECVIEYFRIKGKRTIKSVAAYLGHDVKTVRHVLRKSSEYLLDVDTQMQARIYDLLADVLQQDQS